MPALVFASVLLVSPAAPPPDCFTRALTQWALSEEDPELGFLEELNKALLLIGRAFVFGGAEDKGISIDPIAGADCIRRAAENGSHDAQALLGALYSDGHGVPQNDVLAYQWLILGTMRGELEAAWTVRDRVRRRLTPAQVSRAQEAAAQWLEQQEQEEPER